VSHPVQTFTVAQAAEVCQVSRKTITRRYDQLKLGGAFKDKAGQWAIPVAALLHAGLTPGRPAAPDTVSSTQASTLGQQDTATGLRVAELEAKVTEYRHRAEVAEQLAAERSARVEDLRQALRMLEASRPVQESEIRRDVAGLPEHEASPTDTAALALVAEPRPHPESQPTPGQLRATSGQGWWRRWRRRAAN